MKGIINWNKLREVVYGESRHSDDPEKFWGPFGDMYNKMSQMERKFTTNQINMMDIKETDIVLDIGCGTGRLSVPAAKKAQKVIAIDASSNMLNYAKQYANEEGVNNLEFHKLNWYNEELIKKLETPDIVIVSRTEALSDIERLSNLAKRRVYMLCFANGPSLREIQLDLFKGVEGNPQIEFNKKRELGYNIDFNRVYDSGIDVSVVVVKDGFNKEYNSNLEAYKDLKSLGNVNRSDETIFRSNVNKYLREKSDGGVEFYRETSSYIMWWDTNK